MPLPFHGLLLAIFSPVDIITSSNNVADKFSAFAEIALSERFGVSRMAYTCIYTLFLEKRNHNMVKNATWGKRGAYIYTFTFPLPPFGTETKYLRCV